MNLTKFFIPTIFFSPISEFTNNAPKETGKTFSENAIIKAKHAEILSIGSILA